MTGRLWFGFTLILLLVVANGFFFGSSDRLPYQARAVKPYAYSYRITPRMEQRTEDYDQSPHYYFTKASQIIATR